MDLKARYRQAMEALYLACIVVSGAALIVITLIIPLGVFMRYVMNSPLSWPEPASVLMMVMFSFLGGAAVYRANVHIAVEALVKVVAPGARRILLGAADAVHDRDLPVHGGVRRAPLPWRLWHQSIAEFPGLSVGLTYMPIPIGGFFTLLFILERLWVGPLPETSIVFRDQPSAVGVGHGRPHPARLVCRPLRDRHAGRLCAGIRRDPRRALGGHPARGGDAQDLRRHRRLRAARDPVLRARRRDHGRGRDGDAPDQPRQGVRRRSSAAASRSSTSSRARSSAASRARRWPTPPRSAR